MTSRTLPARILVAIDFSDASASAAVLAGTLAQTFGATLTALHAETPEMPPYFTSTEMDELEADRRAAREAAADDVRAFMTRWSEAPFDSLVVDGPPAEAIRRLAPQFDLVVLGTHRRRGPIRWWRGSVAETVVRSAGTAVLVTHAMDEAAYAPFRERRVSIVLAGDDTEDSVEWVETFERSFGAHVVRLPAPSACTPGHLTTADLVVIGPVRGNASDVLTDQGIRALHTCVRPLLFVPERASISERTAQ